MSQVSILPSRKEDIIDVKVARLRQDGIEIPGIIEFSNLRSVGNDAIVYVPYYMPVTNAKFSWPDDRLCDDAFTCLRQVNPTLEPMQKNQNSDETEPP